MGADEPAGGGSANEIAARDQPEIARTQTNAERLERRTHRTAGGQHHDLRPSSLTVGRKTHVLRPIPHQEGYEGDQCERNASHGERHRAPAIVRCDAREHGKEQELTSRGS